MSLFPIFKVNIVNGRDKNKPDKIVVFYGNNLDKNITEILNSEKISFGIKELLSLEKNDDLIPIRNFSFDAYYTYFAFQQTQKVSKKSLMAQLKTNPHPLSKYRCNVPLSRSEIFRALYNVKRGDGMWWHNTNMVW